MMSEKDGVVFSDKPPPFTGYEVVAADSTETTNDDDSSSTTSKNDRDNDNGASSSSNNNRANNSGGGGDGGHKMPHGGSGDPSSPAPSTNPGLSGGESQSRFSRSWSKARMPGRPLDPTVHPSPSLKVGVVLRGKLLSENGQSSISASHDDGSILLTRVAGEPPLDQKGKQTGPIPTTVMTLIRSNLDKVNRVYQLRADLDDETVEIKKLMRDGKPPKKGVKKAVLGIFPWGEAGWLYRREMAHAKAHRGEVEVIITERGVVVSVIAAIPEA